MTLQLKTLTALLPSLTVALASAIGSAAVAQTTAPPAKVANSLKALDANKDRQMSREEVKGHTRLEKNFEAIDTNKNGQLSRQELKAFRAAQQGQAKK